MSEEQLPDLQAPMRIEDDTKCLQCGYALRGLAADSICPECGAQISKSIAYANNCTARAIFAAGLRFVAIMTLLLLFHTDYGWLNLLLWMFTQGYLDTDLVQWVVVILGGLITLGTSILLWVLAPMLARSAIPNDLIIFPNERHKNLLSIALLIFSGWLLVTGVEGLLQAAVQYLALYDVNHDYGIAFSIGMVASGLFRIIIALALIVWLRLHGKRAA